jgi:hypothetical protein
MADPRAKQGIAMWEIEEAKVSNFRNVWQDTADLVYPRENQITSKRTPGEDKSQYVLEDSPMLASQKMASKLSNALVPYGRQFFSLIAKDRQINDVESVKRWLSFCTQILHDELLDSNFIVHLYESLRSLCVFGTCNLFSEWSVNRRTAKLKMNVYGKPSYGSLNFKDIGIAHYTIKQGEDGNIDTVIVKYPLTARQAVQRFGEKAGDSTMKLAGDVKTESKLCDFIHIVRPLAEGNEQFVKNLAMPFESVHINIKDQEIAEEGGYEELPYSVARWMKSSDEKYGRGQGTEFLGRFKRLQKEYATMIKLANRIAEPPLQVKSSFEGRVRTQPNSINKVMEENSIMPLYNMSAQFPYTEKFLEEERKVIREVFFLDVFSPITNLSGDRRTQMEINQRTMEGYEELASPVARTETELLNANTKRSFMLCYRNGRFPTPPAELMKINRQTRMLELDIDSIGLEFIGKLSLALRNQQSQAFQNYAVFLGQMDAQFPGIKRPSDNINIDKGFRRMGRVWGVAEEDLTTEDERDAIRKDRMQEMQQQKAAMAAATAADAYGKTTGKPEEGSAAEKAMSGMGA